MYLRIENNNINFFCGDNEHKNIISKYPDLAVELYHTTDENWYDNLKLVNDKIVSKTEADLQAENEIKNFHQAKQNKWQEHQSFLSAIVMKINGFALWYDSTKRGNLINTMNANTESGQEFMPLRITEDVCFVKDEAQRKRILTSEFLVKISEFKALMIEAGIYAQNVKLREVEITNKIKYASAITELDAINVSEGYPAEFNRTLRFY